MAWKQKARDLSSTIHNFVNQRRENHGLPKLRARRDLNRAAENYAREMADAGRIGHHVDSQSLPKRYPGYKGLSENCTKIRRVDRPIRVLAGDAVKGWMASDGHRENILRKRSSYDGVGVWIRGDTAMIAHCFAAERSRSLVGSLVPRLLK